MFHTRWAKRAAAVRTGGWVMAAATAALLVAPAGRAARAQERPDFAEGCKVHPVLAARLAEAASPVKTWVFFTDKGCTSPEQVASALRTVEQTYDARALARRQMRGDNAVRGGALVDEHDLPVSDAYLRAVADTGAEIHVVSRWLNAASVWATAEQVELLAALPFVDRLEAVRQSFRRPDPPATPAPEASPADAAGPGSDFAPGSDAAPAPADAEPGATTAGDRIAYGTSAAQLQQINLPALHDAGFTGAGVVIGILDSGFRRSHIAFTNTGHPLQVLAEYDFVNNDDNTAPQAGDPSSQHEHGTMILGCIGAYQPGTVVGGAYDASFVLCKTEDTSQEVPAEEDNFVAGLEFIEAHGADASTASLGYIDWYIQSQLDGQTAVTTVAINVLSAAGVHHTNAAGNEGHDSNPATAHLIAPADGFQVITCGAVDSSGAIASFSSDGPTADGRVKPEVLARGVTTYTVDPFASSGTTTADGTSLSTPLVACAVACLTQARPHWTVDQMRQNLFETANYYTQHGTYDPQYVRGYGIINAYAAYTNCPAAGTVQLDPATLRCDGAATVIATDCGLNANSNVIEHTTLLVTSSHEPAGELMSLTESGPGTSEFIGTLPLSASDAPGVLCVGDGDTVTVTYVDADNGAGGHNVLVTATAAVDCAPPLISGVHAQNIGSDGAEVALTCSEPVRATVNYGLSCGALNQHASTTDYSLTPVVPLGGMTANTKYYFAVQVTDAAGNVSVDDGGGACYWLRTRNGPQALYSFPLDADPGFARQGQWAFGAPTGHGGSSHGHPDPTGGATGANVFGVNLSGDYATTTGGPYYLTTGSLDLHTATDVELRFQRWLNTDWQPYAIATVEVTANNGNTWHTVWQNTTAEIADGAWNLQTIDVSAIANEQALVRVRWGYRTAYGAWAYSGWNIDDIQIWGTVPLEWVAGDLNCDFEVTFDDINPFVRALSGQTSYESAYPDCHWLNADTNDDGVVNFDDIRSFVRLLGH